MITIPRTLEALQACAMAGDKRYQEWLGPLNKKANHDDWETFKMRTKPNAFKQSCGPTLDHLIEKEPER